MEEKIKILLEIAKIAKEVGSARLNLVNHVFVQFAIDDIGIMHCEYEPKDSYEDTKYVDITLEDLKKDPEQHRKEHIEELRKQKEKIDQILAERKKERLLFEAKSEKELYLRLKKKYEKYHVR